MGAEIDPRKVRAKAKTEHDLHVLLIMQQTGVGKSDALFEAYREGLTGLERRLGLSGQQEPLLPMGD